jgi:hypothetical protein
VYGQDHAGSFCADLTRDVRTPAVSKPREGKATDFESPGELGTRQKARRQYSLDQQQQGAGPKDARMLEKGLFLQVPEVKSPNGSRRGGNLGRPHWAPSLEVA